MSPVYIESATYCLIFQPSEKWPKDKQKSAHMLQYYMLSLSKKLCDSELNAKCVLSGKFDLLVYTNGYCFRLTPSLNSSILIKSPRKTEEVHLHLVKHLELFFARNPCSSTVARLAKIWVNSMYLSNHLDELGIEILVCAMIQEMNGSKDEK